MGDEGLLCVEGGWAGGIIVGGALFVLRHCGDGNAGEVVQCLPRRHCEFGDKRSNPVPPLLTSLRSRGQRLW